MSFYFRSKRDSIFRIVKDLSEDIPNRTFHYQCAPLFFPLSSLIDYLVEAFGLSFCQNCT